MKCFSVFLAVALVLIATTGAHAQLSNYSQDFESLNAVSGTALGDDGWLVFANVFAPDGTTFLYPYGPFPAPNGSGGFSNVLTTSPPAGAQGLVTFSDYNNGDHNIGNVIETNVFQEQTIGAGDVGKTASFSFLAEDGDIGGSSTALAFIKTLDSGTFALKQFLTFDTTSLSGVTPGTLTLPIDGTMVGDIFQFGFLTTAANFEPSGVHYDNVNFVIPEPGTISLAGLGLCAIAGLRRRS